MGRCIHFKNGKYAEWGSISDSYVSCWLSRKDFMCLLLGERPFKDRHSKYKIWELKERMLKARVRGCSIIPKMIRHTKDEI